MGLTGVLRGWAAAGVPAPRDVGRRLDAVDAQLSPLLDSYQRSWVRQGWYDRDFGDDALAGPLREASEDTLRAAALWGHRLLCRTRDLGKQWPARDLVTALARRKLAWTAEEAEWALRLTLVRGEYDYDALARIRLPLAAAARLPVADLERLRAPLAELRRRLSGPSSELTTAEVRPLDRRIGALLGERATALAALPPSLLHDGDEFGPALRRDLGARLDAPGVPALLVHAAACTGPRPSNKWRAEGHRLLAAAEDGVAVAREVLERALQHRETLVRSSYGPGLGDGEWFLWVHESTARLLRGLVLLVGELDRPWVAPLLGGLLEHAGSGLGGSSSSPRDLVVVNATVAALGRRDDAVPQLSRAQGRLTNRTARKGIAAALTAAAQRSGVTVAELAEAGVPTHGLDRSGRRTEVLGSHRAELSVTGPSTVRLSFRDGTGRTLASVPAAVRAEHAGRLAELRAEVKDLRRTLSAQRLRIESLLAADRRWSADTWARCYRDHPVVGCLARGLLWQVRDASGWRTGLLSEGGRLVGLDGSALPDGDVRLWHPLLAGREEVRAWRDHLLAAELRQPVTQAFREVYRITDAEIGTGDHSNRFAAHVLRAPQAQALMRTRGWVGNSLGHWDGGFEGHVTKQFDGGWRAEFFFDLVEEEADGSAVASLASSDQVRFSRQDGADRVHRPLVEVPPLVFSEAMRDVDLFVGVTSIATDPTWIDRGAREHGTYWEQMSVGALSELAATRRESLERLVPRLRIADRCTLTERFLEVRGDLRTYRIHLGSGNILMSPDDEYLCIVPGRGSAWKEPPVFLPFEEDGGMLSVILSKAFLLADDAAITDPSITSQIGRR